MSLRMLAERDDESADVSCFDVRQWNKIENNWEIKVNITVDASSKGVTYFDYIQNSITEGCEKENKILYVTT